MLPGLEGAQGAPPLPFSRVYQVDPEFFDTPLLPDIQLSGLQLSAWKGVGSNPVPSKVVACAGCWLTCSMTLSFPPSNAALAESIC